MKKIFTLIAALMCVSALQANTYTDKLIVTVNGSSSQQNATITVDEKDGLATLSLKNFVLEAGGSKMGIGNIELKDLKVEKAGGQSILSTKQTITITSGDDASIDTWLGPILGAVPVELRAKYDANKLFAGIDIDMSATLQQIIAVNFGDVYQIGNSGFEAFHNETCSGKTNPEPNNWHSFTSATGKAFLLAATAGMPSVSQSDKVRPGSTGNSSVLIVSHSVLGKVANGTLTTGRLNAGNATPDDYSNYSCLDMSSTALDGNGDPFYAALDGQPDEISLWVKFKQTNASAQYPYATMSAVITDGTEYREPSKTVYKNVLMSANNSKITACDWTKLIVPFAYKNKKLAGKGIMVTLSTNATPGKGGIDSLYVDDVELVYKAKLKTVKYGELSADFSNATEATIDLKGAATVQDVFDGMTTEIEGNKALVGKTLNDDNTVTIKVYSQDLKTVNTYTLKLNGTASVVDQVVKGEKTVAGIYTLNGVKVNDMTVKGIYVVKYTDGTAAKVIKK